MCCFAGSVSWGLYLCVAGCPLCCSNAASCHVNAFPVAMPSPCSACGGSNQGIAFSEHEVQTDSGSRYRSTMSFSAAGWASVSENRAKF